MRRKCLDHSCPVCKEKVYAYRKTRIYCSDTCKSLHHRQARKQIETRVNEEEELEYIQLFSRNLYLIESVMGPKYSLLSVKLKEFEIRKFQFGSYSESFVKDDTTFYKLSNYLFWKKNEILHVKRVAPGVDYMDFVVDRWLLTYPDFKTDAGMSKKRILESGNVWRE